MGWRETTMRMVFVGMDGQNGNECNRSVPQGGVKSNGVWSGHLSMMKSSCK